MRIGIMSDSHDNLPLVARAVDVFNRQSVGLVLHAGDFISGFTASVFKDLNCRLVGVYGNNDGDRLYLKRRFEDIGDLYDDYREMDVEGKRLVLMHQPKFIELLAARSAYDLIVYGHTHEIDIRQGPPLVVNPGECGGWTTGTATVVIVDLDSMSAELLTL